MQFIKYRFAQTNGAIYNMAAYFTANGIALFADAVDIRYHFFCSRRIGTADDVFFAFVYNALGIPIAAGLLYPFFGLLLSPIIAGVAMSLSSVSVITNALRLRHAKL